MKDVRIVNIASLLSTLFCIYAHTYVAISVHVYCYIHVHTHVGATSVEAYFPKGSRWYDVYTNKIVAAAGGATMTLDSPMDHIPVS